MSREVCINRLGAQGDGVTLIDGAPAHIPFALPGERVRVSPDGKGWRLDAVLEASPGRAAPPCRHFTKCGGCTLQHLAAEPYRAFKRDLVERALAARGLDIPVDPVLSASPATRRRAAFRARRQGRGVVLGFHGRRSHELIALSECPVLRPAIVSALPALADIAARAAPARGELSLLVTEAGNGLDLHLSGLTPGLTHREQMALTAAAMAAGFIRITLENGDGLTGAVPLIDAGAARIPLPPGGFLQATQEGEAHLVAGVLDHLSGARRIADLFAGAGTFALRLAVSSTVHAVEGSAPALAALARAARGAPGLKPVTTETRDLARRPLRAEELSRFDGAVIDPPFAGAREQVAELARADLARLACVSCNPATLARDLRTLVDGGWRLTRVTPVDLFLWSAHVETVARLER